MLFVLWLGQAVCTNDITGQGGSEGKHPEYIFISNHRYIYSPVDILAQGLGQRRPMRFQTPLLLSLDHKFSRLWSWPELMASSSSSSSSPSRRKHRGKAHQKAGQKKRRRRPRSSSPSSLPPPPQVVAVPPTLAVALPPPLPADFVQWLYRFGTTDFGELCAACVLAGIRDRACIAFLPSASLPDVLRELQPQAQEDEKNAAAAFSTSWCSAGGDVQEKTLRRALLPSSTTPSQASSTTSIRPVVLSEQCLLGIPYIGQPQSAESMESGKASKAAARLVHLFTLLGSASLLSPSLTALPSLSLRTRWLSQMHENLTDFDARGLNAAASTFERWRIWALKEGLNPYAPSGGVTALFLRDCRKGGKTAARGVLARLAFLESHIGAPFEAKQAMVQATSRVRGHAEHVQECLTPSQVTILLAWTHAKSPIVAFVAMCLWICMVAVLRRKHLQRSKMTLLQPSGTLQGIAFRGKTRKKGAQAPPFTWTAARCKLTPSLEEKFMKARAAAGLAEADFVLPGINHKDVWAATAFTSAPMGDKAFNDTLRGLLSRAPTKEWKLITSMPSAQAASSRMLRRTGSSIGSLIKLSAPEHHALGNWELKKTMPETYTGPTERSQMAFEAKSKTFQVLDSLVPTVLAATSGACSWKPGTNPSASWSDLLAASALEDKCDIAAPGTPDASSSSSASDSEEEEEQESDTEQLVWTLSTTGRLHRESCRYKGVGGSPGFGISAARALSRPWCQRCALDLATSTD